MATTRQAARPAALVALGLALGLALWLSPATTSRADPPRGPAGAAPAKAVPRWNSGAIREVVALKQAAPSWAVAFSSDGKLLAAAGMSQGGVAPGWVAFWDAATWKELRTIKVEDARIFRLGFVPGKPLLVAGAIDASRLFVCDPKDGSLRAFSRNIDGGSYGQSHFVFSPDGRQMMTVNPCDGAMIWDTATWLIVQNVPGARDHDMALAVDPSEDWEFPGGDVYTAEPSGVVRRCHPVAQTQPPAPEPRLPGARNDLPWQTLWRFDRVRGVKRPWGMADVTAPALSRDGKSAALCVLDDDLTGHIDLYDVSPKKEWTRRSRIDLAAHGNVYSLAFAPDGGALVAGCADRTVRLWDAATAKPLPSLVGHVGAVNGLAFSADGSLLATSDSSDGTVRVWSPHAGD